MNRKIIAIWIFLSSVAAALMSASLVWQTVHLYGPGQLRALGPHVTLASQNFASWLPYGPDILFGVTAASIVTVIYFWRSNRASDHKSFAITLIAAINCFLALFLLMLLVSAYFVLPKLANGA